jgi:hypothetical protein
MMVMKKLPVLIVMIVGALTGCCAQAPTTNDHLKLFGLNGPVVEVKEIHFQELYIEVYQFDTNGRLIHYHSLANPGLAMEEDMDFWETTASYDYWYDEQGQIQGDEEDIQAFPQPYEAYGDPEVYTVRRNSHGQIVEFGLKRFPDDEKVSIRWFYDAYGNWVGSAEFWLNEYDVDIKNVISREIKYSRNN